MLDDLYSIEHQSADISCYEDFLDEYSAYEHFRCVCFLEKVNTTPSWTRTNFQPGASSQALSGKIEPHFEIHINAKARSSYREFPIELYYSFRSRKKWTEWSRRLSEIQNARSIVLVDSWMFPDFGEPTIVLRGPHLTVLDKRYADIFGKK